MVKSQLNSTFLEHHGQGVPTATACGVNIEKKVEFFLRRRRGKEHHGRPVVNATACGVSARAVVKGF